MKNFRNKNLSKAEVRGMVDAYFTYIEGEYHIEKIPAKKPADAELIEQKVYTRSPEDAAITGLAFFLGFNSREEFALYESTGKYASILKRARLRIEAIYERRLHQTSPTGAIFALKSMGWNEKEEKTKVDNKTKSLKVKIIETGPAPVSTEKEVVLQ